MVFGTSSSDLKNIIESLGIGAYFIGVYDKHFPGFLDVNRTAYAIVNTGDYVSGGVHWIAFAYDHVSLKFYVFDPFGWNKKQLLQFYRFEYDSMVKRTAMSLKSKCVRFCKSVEAVQCPCSAACGLFCCLFLASFYSYRSSPFNNNPIIDIVQGVPIKKLMTAYGITVTHRNQKNLYIWLYLYSSYFRKHMYEIKRNTKINAVKMH